jgi:hypothetical protein
MRPRLLLLLAVLVVGGCATPTPGGTSSPSTSSTVPSPAASPVSAPASSASAAEDGGEYRVTYGFAVPSNLVTINHDVNPPPLPTLIGIYVGNHPEGAPAYQRISFYFRTGFPTYRFQYVAQVISDGRGDVVPLPGNSFLSIVFTTAWAHNDSGASTVAQAAPQNIGFPNLRGYAPAGDFEGHVSFGLGIQAAPNSDQALPIRAGELTRPDGTFVVHFDVQTA